MKVVYYGYRNWSQNIFKGILFEKKYLITHDDYSLINKIKPELVFFVGWSSIIPEKIIKNFTCICLHPSNLPKYRGGSPIQHQIINGESKSAVSLFIMDKGIDTGKILIQKEISLKGTLKDIFKEIEVKGIDSINEIISSYISGRMLSYEQDESKATFFNRRKPNESEITFEELKNYPPRYIHNKVRALNDPYPNAYIKCKNGKKIYILKTKID